MSDWLLLSRDNHHLATTSQTSVELRHQFGISRLSLAHLSRGDRIVILFSLLLIKSA